MIALAAILTLLAADTTATVPSAVPIARLAAAPGALVVETPRGERRLPVRFDRAGAPVLAAPPLIAALNGSVEVRDGWVEVVIAKQAFQFLIGAPLYRIGDRVEPLAAPVSVARDTAFLPFQFVAEVMPRVLGDRYRYDSAAGRLVEAGAQVVATPARAEPRLLPNGLRPGHVVTIDPGHGGVDPGTAGTFLPRGIREKNITLAIGHLVRDELKRRGVGVRMTRTTDTLIALGDRGSYCTRACDLFVSLHVNALPKRPGYSKARGFETYFLAEAKTEDAARVARMENEAVRFEASRDEAAMVSGLDFILKDLQLNEHLRESARAAELVQASLEEVHPGTNRGVKQAGFMVLTTARRPAILVELGYGTNPEDGRLLTTASSQKKLAVAVADAIVAYLLEYERKTGTAADSGKSR